MTRYFTIYNGGEEAAQRIIKFLDSVDNCAVSRIESKALTRDVYGCGHITVTGRDFQESDAVYLRAYCDALGDMINESEAA